MVTKCVEVNGRQADAHPSGAASLVVFAMVRTVSTHLSACEPEDDQRSRSSFRRLSQRLAQEDLQPTRRMHCDAGARPRLASKGTGLRRRTIDSWTGIKSYYKAQCWLIEVKSAVYLAHFAAVLRGYQ